MPSNLLFVSSYSDLGGGETALLSLAAYLDPARFRPHLLVPREGQLAAAAAVRGVLDLIAAAVDAAVPALQRGGRIVYAGAGTSGRIGVQDGAELAPTYDWPADRLVFAIAGGVGALVKSVEGAEDDEAAGERAASEAGIGPDDVVIGVAASGSTPYTIGVLRAATAKGAG